MANHRNVRFGVQQAEVASKFRSAARGASRIRVERLFRGVEVLTSRALDMLRSANVRVQSKAARADAALGRGIDRTVNAPRKKEAEGVQTSRDELLTLQQTLSNRFSAMLQEQLREIMTTLQSDTLATVRSELIDGPP